MEEPRDRSREAFHLAISLGLAGAMLVMVAAGVLSAGDDASERVPCPERVGILKAGLVSAMNRSVRGQHFEAQEVALLALSEAGYRCRWLGVGSAAPGGADKSPRLTLRCDE